MRFNHVIVTVPVERDTIWLECTSQMSPMGYMGTFTSDRNCLLIGENGGRLMQNGCRYLVDKKKYSFYQCLHYYYDYSIDGSTGGPLRFFDNNKIDLGK